MLRPYLSRRSIIDADKFAALHAACWSGGTLLYVPQGVAIAQPLHMLSASRRRHRPGPHAGRARRGRRSDAAGRNRQQRPSGRPGLHCGAIEILVGPGARLRYVNLQNWGTGVWHFAHQRALVERDAALQWTIGALGAGLAKVNQHVALVGPGAEARSTA